MKYNFKVIVAALDAACSYLTDEYNHDNSGANIAFEVLQQSDYSNCQNIFEWIHNFYNENWVGNKHFIHVPSVEQLKESYEDFPIVVATDKDTKEMLGIVTLKHHDNITDDTDPFYPKPEEYFSITGILTKRNSGFRNIGKRLYEACILGCHAYSKLFPGVKLNFEIDCRNKNSLEACKGAVRRINANSRAGVGKSLSASLDGYYVYENVESEELLDPPIFVFDIDLEEKDSLDQSITGQSIVFNNHNPDNIFGSLLSTVQADLHSVSHRPITTYMQSETERVSYFPMIGLIDMQSLTVVPNNTGLGQNRVKEKKLAV